MRYFLLKSICYTHGPTGYQPWYSVVQAGPLLRFSHFNCKDLCQQANIVERNQQSLDPRPNALLTEMLYK